MAPFFMASPDRVRESIARVFRGGHVPERLASVLRNEIDAIMLVFAIEVRMWARALQVPQERIVELWTDGIPERDPDLILDAAFWNGLRFLIAPPNEGDRDGEVTISYAQDRLSLTARPQLRLMAELIQVAEYLSLFTDEPQHEERDDEAGDLRRALRRGAQISRGSWELCVIRVPHLTRRQYQDALSGFFASGFLPLLQIDALQGAAAGNRWLQIRVEALRPDAGSARPRTLVDRLKYAARDQFAELASMSGPFVGTLARLSASAGLATFLDGAKPGLIVVGAGGAGKSALLRQLVEPGIGNARTVLVYPLRKRGGVRHLNELLLASIGASAAQEGLLIEIARAFAQREEELVVVLDGLNEVGDLDDLLALFSSVLEGASLLAGPEAPGSGLRIVLTSRPETYFRACARLCVSPSPKAFAHIPQEGPREPHPYLEVKPLTQAERETLFGLYFADGREDGAEHEITRAARRDRRFAALLSRPIMIALAGELYRRGVPIGTLRSSIDLVDLAVDQGFERLASAKAAEEAWRVVERIFEHRLRMREKDVVKFEDLWMTPPDDRETVVTALMNLADMGILQPYLDQPNRLVEFSHERFEENLLGRYLDRLDATAMAAMGRENADYAVGTCMALSGAKTLFEEALTHHLRSALESYLTSSGDVRALARRWTRLRRSTQFGDHAHGLDRILAKSMIEVEKRRKSHEKRWFSPCLKGFVEQGSGTPDDNAGEAVIRSLLAGLEALTEARTPGLSSLAAELRHAARGFLADDTFELRCNLLIVRSLIEAERWADALAEVERATVASAVVISTEEWEKLRLSRGIALRNLGRIREAASELEAVLASQLTRGDVEGAVQTLPSLVEAVREFGEFERALEIIGQVEGRAGAITSAYARLLLAMWRGVLHKNLMQDAVLFRWDAGSGSFSADRDQAQLHRSKAEDALSRALDIAVAYGSDDTFPLEIAQVYSELAETSLSYALLDSSALPEADRHLEELARLLALRFAVEPQVEYLRHSAHRSAFDGGFAAAFGHLRKARKLAAEYGMRFLQADCDLDWARIVARSPSSFRAQQIRDARVGLVQAATYLRGQVGADTYYPKITDVLMLALDHALASRKRALVPRRAH